MDESMFGNMKYGKGDGSKRRRAWVFGMVCRATKQVVFIVCPRDEHGKYKRTKAALWPIVQAHVKVGSTLYTDGWRVYRRLPELGYSHEWVNHDLYYVDPNNRNLHTNEIEGAWGLVKMWLPNGGAYNLQDYLYLYQWFHTQKIAGINPFHRLMHLIAENNSVEVLTEALQKTPRTDTVSTVWGKFLMEYSWDCQS